MKIELPKGKISLFLRLASIEYELSSFRVHVRQKTDYKGQPQSDTYGGIVDFSMTNLPDELLNRWMLRESELMNGQFDFRQGDASNPLTIRFENAYCVGYEKQVAVNSKNGIVVNFRITANEIWFNEKSLFNNWRL